MASNPASGAIGVELQTAGENLNTWGDPKLNNALQVLVNLSHGWKAWTINGNYTVSETSYATTNDTENAFIKLVAGTVSAAFNVTYPGRNKRHVVWNATSYAATIKLSATSGFTLPAGGIALVATDGVTDIYNVSPTHAGRTTQDTASNAYALWGAVQSAIATASLPATAGTVLVSGADTTAGYLGAKIVAGTDATVVDSGAGNATLTVGTVPYWNTPRNLAFADSPITALDRDVIELNTSGGAITINLPASGRVWVVDKSGNAGANNVTLVPSGADTVTFGTLDVNYFGVIFRKNSTNWDLN